MATAESTSPKANPGRPAVKILRACVVQGGKVLEEQRLRPKQALTIGTGSKNTFTVADPALPKSHTLFANKGGTYELVFTEAMRGKISVTGESEPADLASLKSEGKAEKRGSTYHLPLTDRHRGKVVIGDATIIFQFVAPPPEPAKPKLPKAARGTLWTSIDWPYAAALSIMFVLEAPVVIAFRYVDPPEEFTLDDLADSRFAELIIPEYKPEEAKAEPTTDAEGEAVTAKKKEQAKDDSSDDDPAEQAAKRAARKEGIRKEIAGKGILAILGSAGEGSTGGAVADVFGSGSLGGDLDGAFEGIAGVGLATASSERTTRGGGSGEAASIGGLATEGGGEVGLKGKEERKVASSVETATPDVDGALDSGAIAKVVRSRMRSIQDCYEKELKRDPTLAGKIEIEFTIDESGAVEEAVVVSDKMGSSAVGSCIVSRIRRWRFPKPDGGSVTVNYPFIFTASS